MKSALLAGVLVSSAAASACVVSVDSQALIVRDEKRFSVQGSTDLDLNTFDGAIEVRSWDRPEVLVEIEKRGATKEAVDGLEVVADQQGNRITVEVKKPRTETLNAFGIHHSTSAKLTVSLPERTNITARSGDGSIRIERVHGRLELRTGDGSITANDVGGELVLNTGDGSVRVSKAEGNIDVDTGDGSVDVGGHLSIVKLHTGDGSIVYRADAGSSMTGDWDISTGDGGITLYLPNDFNAELDAHTGDGGIRNDLAIHAEADGNAGSDGDRERDRRTLRTRLGSGGKVLRVRSGDGGIRLKSS